MAVTELSNSRMVVYLEQFVPGSQQQQLLMPAAAVGADGGPKV